MKLLTLNKPALSVLNAASKDKTRYQLNSIHFDKGHVVASDGHWLARVSLPAANTAALECVPAGFIPEAESSETFTVPREVAEAMQKAIPKDHPNVYISANCKTATWKTTDFKNQTSQQFTTVEGQYPDYAQVFPQGEVKSEICLNADILAKVCKAAAEFYGKKEHKSDITGIRIKIRGNMDPVEIEATQSNSEGQTFTALIMPIKSPVRP